jgi:maltose alpha-D-glucosyltransferase/alpha-amylase
VSAHQERGRTPIEAAVASLSSDALLRFLEQQRWFGAKAAAGARASVASHLVMPWGHGAFAITRVVVESAGDKSIYQLLLAARDAAATGTPQTAVVARGEAVGKPLVIYDALFDPDFRVGLVRALQSTGTVAAEGPEKFSIERFGNHSLRDDAHTALASAEQSNTSVIIDDEAILKLYRLLRPGVHPDVEVSQFLTTRARFANTPSLIATLTIDDGRDSTVAGMVQEYLPESSDAWSYALERGRAYFAAPATREAPNTFIDDAKRLGAVTRGLHAALSSDDDDPAFAPEAAAPEDLDRWAHRTQQSVRDALALLERQITSSSFPKDHVAEAQALVKRRDHYLGWINEIADQLGDDLGMRTRTHGDYHLGQVLRARSGEFMVIDFEGEPARSLAERREKTSPLRDVAGMLRSIAYAASTLAMTHGREAPPHVRELRAARWERDVRSAFLSAYFAPEAEDEGILPDSLANAEQLVTLFETEKAFYELSYELNNRPAWVWIPMRGISKLFVAGR